MPSAIRGHCFFGNHLKIFTQNYKKAFFENTGSCAPKSNIIKENIS